jgi:hypothetical protein
MRGGFDCREKKDEIGDGEGGNEIEWLDVGRANVCGSE